MRIFNDSNGSENNLNQLLTQKDKPLMMRNIPPECHFYLGFDKRRDISYQSLRKWLPSCKDWREMLKGGVAVTCTKQMLHGSLGGQVTSSHKCRNGKLGSPSAPTNLIFQF